MTNTKVTRPNCISKMVGRHFESPRKIFSDKRIPQGFLFKKMGVEEQKVAIRFDNNTHLALHFWRFNLVYGILRGANGTYIALCSSLDSEKSETIESMLYEEAKRMKYSYARLRTAAFVCDFLVLCNIAQYGVINNPATGRSVQAIRST